MFESSVYVNRRAALRQRMAGSKGIAIFVGNVDAAMNYRGNDYKFRQDSNFMYFWGIDEPAFAAVIDLEAGTECLYGNDVDIDDIIWMGPQPSVASKGELIGCACTAPLAEFDKVVAAAVSAGRPVHFLPPSRYYNTMKIASLTGIPMEAVEDILDYEEISADMASRGEYFGLKIKGDSMFPLFQAGDTVIVRRQPDAESGEIAVVLVNGNDATVKKIIKKDTSIVLVSENSAYEPMIFTKPEIESLPVTVIGKVVELRRKF